MNNVVNELCFINVMTNNKYKNVKIVIQKQKASFEYYFRK